ncbi:hypothetical protein [Sorangium sp. So ce131]|uniref:hypothetical protein n=1 Tax=Sorangium sp. So ce131 TaxID=3133282 RepID=UPI003F5DBA50
MNGFLLKRRGLILGSIAALVGASGCVADAGDDAGDLAGDESAIEETGTSSEASTVNGSGWAWVLSSGSVGGSYFYNSRGGSVVGTQLATGQYQVDFNAMRTGGSAQVVAYGSNAHCKLFTVPISSGAKTSLFVSCHTAAGGFADSAFVVFFDSRSGTDTSPYGGAYLSTGGGTSPSPTGASWNSSGGVNSVSWSAANSMYVVTLPGMASANAAVHVTAYGANANRCKVVSWGTGVVNVRCYDATGTPVSTNGFSLSYLDRSLIPGHIGGHAWITGGSVGTGYAAAVGTFSCFAPGSFSVAPNASNTWDLDVSLTDSDWGGDTGPWFVPMITAYGSSSNYCSIVNWGASAATGTTTVRVRCFDTNGNQVNASNTAFTSSITHWSSPGPC